MFVLIYIYICFFSQTLTFTRLYICIYLYIHILYIYICMHKVPPKKTINLISTNQNNNPSVANFSTSLRASPCQYKIWRCKWSPLTVPGMNFPWCFGTREVKVPVSTVSYPLLKTFSFENWWLEDVPFEMVRWHSFIFRGVPLDYRALGVWSLWLELLFSNGCLSKQTNKWQGSTQK